LIARPQFVAAARDGMVRPHAGPLRLGDFSLLLACRHSHDPAPRQSRFRAAGKVLSFQVEYSAGR
jgi:hypothetical protein